MRIIATLSALAVIAALPASARAHEHRSAAAAAPVVEYEISELDGTSGSGASVNNRGWVAGSAKVEGGFVHAMLWRNGKPHDLKTLGGPHSAVNWPSKNESGIIVGISHTAEVDERGEEWSCVAFIPHTGKVCRGFVWQNNKMTQLDTFGGTHSFAAGVNNRGQVAGWAETADPDPSCKGKQVLGFRAAIWDANTGAMRQLPPLSKDVEDSTSAATAINDFGQVVGISGDCNIAVGITSARRAVMWENGRVIEIGGFGADAWNTPMAISATGTVVGFANRAGTVGETLNEEAFLWTRRGGIRPLGTLSAGEKSQALGVNILGQVVGISRVGGSYRPFLYENSRMFEVKGAGGYRGKVLSANDINDFGVITGQAVNAAGKTVAYIATRVCR